MYRPHGRGKGAALLAALLWTACGGTRGGSPSLNAVLWVQGAAEYAAAATGAYEMATRSLELGQADSSWTAATEQGEAYHLLPPAVILDVDETVLDNTPYQARLIEDGERFGSDSWAAWVMEARARAIPGALEFTRSAARSGVTVFYVTNRDAELEEATRSNLERLGFPLATATDVILTRGERSEWGSDKSSRRRHIARQYRVIVLVGDDLGDFVATDRAGPAERMALVERSRERWGTRWIVLPNPMYGSWDRSLLGFSDLSEEEAQRLKRERLDALRPPPD
jgi:acid phosphatase